MNRRFVARVWLPDRPGELGQIATALGAANLSLIGIEIIEQGGGWAVDELVIEFSGDYSGPPADEYISISFESLEDVRVESVVPVTDVVDPRVDALQTAAELIEQLSRNELAQRLVLRTLHDFSAEWSVLISKDGEVLASGGTVPAIGWLQAFLEGSKAASESNQVFRGPQDVAWADIPIPSMSLVLGRDGRPFRSRERAQVSTLARIVGVLWTHLE